MVKTELICPKCSTTMEMVCEREVCMWATFECPNCGCIRHAKFRFR